MLDQRNVKGAYSKFNNLKLLLKKYSPSDDFINLQTEVNRAYKAYNMQMARKKTVVKETKIARATPTPKPVRTTQAPKKKQVNQSTKPAQTTKAAKPAEPKTKPIRRVQPTKPKKTVQTARPVRTHEKPKTEQVAIAKQEEKVAVREPAPAPVTTVSSVSNTYNDDPYAAFDKKQQEAHGKATQDVIDIYTLLERQQVRQAYEHFKKNQIPLKTYVSKEVYEVLESTVLQAFKGLSETFE